MEHISVCGRRRMFAFGGYCHYLLNTHTHNVQIEAGQYCSFVIYSDGTMKACGKVGILYYCVFIMVGW